MMRRVALVAAAVLLLGAVVQLQAARERWYPPQDDADTALYLRSPTAVRRMASAYTPLAADLYWIRAVQYYGGTKHRNSPSKATATAPTPPAPPAALARPDDDYTQLYTLLDITTTLDPRFNIAYRFGAIFLAEAYPNGAGRPDLAIALLEKGLRARPDKWEYMEDIAFVHYWYEHDYLGASQWFEKAAAVPGAPWWLQSMAATTRAKGGDRQSSRLMWETIRDTTDIEWLRQDAERKLAQLRALDDIDALQKIVGAEEARTGQVPDGWETLVRARRLRGLPLDPGGTPYVLENGRVGLSNASRLYPLLVEPPAQPGAGPVSGASPTPPAAVTR
jgi:hypothetical protein